MIRRLVKWALNHVPRPVLQRMADTLVPIAGWFYVGRGTECPVCGAKRRKFLPYGYVSPRPNALCPNCLSLERHRLMWLYLTRETTLFSTYPKLLHIAPEVCLMRRLKKHYKDHKDAYVTADLESPLADLHFDVQDIPLPEEYADVIFCNHILEHVDDDLRSMRELCRIMRSGGWGIFLSPVELGRDKTFEDDTITDPVQRTAVFGQYDHKRIYGNDYCDRLRSAGFEVEDIDYAAKLTDAERQLYALPYDHIYLVRKP